MNDAIVKALALSQVIVVYWLFPAMFLRALPALSFRKNPAWVADHPAFEAASVTPAWATGLFYAAGAAWLLVLADAVPAIGKLDLRSASLLPTCIWFAMFAGFMMFDHWRVGRRIPLPARRSASLTRRTVRSYLHPAWVWVCQMGYLSVIGVYALGLYLDVFDTDTGIRRMIGTAATLALTAPVLAWGTCRQPKEQDNLWGPASRKVEVLFMVAVQYAGLLLLGYTLMGDVFPALTLDNTVVLGAINLLTQVFLVVLMLRARHHGLQPALPTPT
jgi:hypothetical protein